MTKFWSILTKESLHRCKRSANAFSHFPNPIILHNFFKTFWQFNISMGLIKYQWWWWCQWSWLWQWWWYYHADEYDGDDDDQDEWLLHLGLGITQQQHRSSSDSPREGEPQGMSRVGGWRSKILMLLLPLLLLIPHICHGSHGYTRVNFFWPV